MSFWVIKKVNATVGWSSGISVPLTWWYTNQPHTLDVVVHKPTLYSDMVVRKPALYSDMVVHKPTLYSDMVVHSTRQHALAS